jgi:hypothetical protein
VLLKQGKSTEAEVQFRKVLELDPENAAALSALQLIAVRSGRDNSVTAASDEHTEAAPAEAAPVEAAPVEAAPVEAAPAEAAPVEAEQVEAEPVQAEPVEAEQVEAEPVEADRFEEEPTGWVDGGAGAGADAAEEHHDAYGGEAGEGMSVEGAPIRRAPAARRVSMKPVNFLPQEEENDEEEVTVDEHGKPLGRVQRLANQFQKKAERAQRRQSLLTRGK